MIYGELKTTEIVFMWKAGDVINFEFFDSSSASLSTTSHTVLESEISFKGELAITIDTPEGTKYVSATSGPDAIPTKQYSVVNGIYNNHMRFEVNKQEVIEGTNTLTLLPVWSAIIISPMYNYYFSGLSDDEKAHLTSFVGMSNITVTQTISGQSPLNITYVGYESSVEVPIKRSGNMSAAPYASYIIVVYPATACDLAVTLNYDASYFTGSQDATYTGTPFTTSVNTDETPINVVSMYTQNQSVPTITKGIAYDIDVLKGHPIDLLWKKN